MIDEVRRRVGATGKLGVNAKGNNGPEARTAPSHVIQENSDPQTLRPAPTSKLVAGTKFVTESKNTLKNQVQVATIETAVVRREGARPDSPTSRVRNTLERQKEERLQRAERRARRAAGSDESGVGETSLGEAEEQEKGGDVEMDDVAAD